MGEQLWQKVNEPVHVLTEFARPPALVLDQTTSQIPANVLLHWLAAVVPEHAPELVFFF